MKISTYVRTTITADGAVLMNIKGGQMITLNPIGSIIWRGLADGRSQEQIASGLASEFGLPMEQTLADVNEFIEQLRAQQLIEPSESEAPRRRSVISLRDCSAIFSESGPLIPCKVRAPNRRQRLMEPQREFSRAKNAALYCALDRPNESRHTDRYGLIVFDSAGTAVMLESKGNEHAYQELRFHNSRGQLKKLPSLFYMHGCIRSFFVFWIA